jgi:hypothetical protein
MKARLKISVARREIEGSIKLVLGAIGLSALLIVFILLLP